jgi:hypothetical protein
MEHRDSMHDCPRRRAECLSAKVFDSLEDAEATLTSWGDTVATQHSHTTFIGIWISSESARFGETNPVR